MTLLYSWRVLISLCVVIMGSTSMQGCASSSSLPPQRCANRSVGGLYEVDNRTCENPLNETDFCPVIQYLELASGAMFGTAAESRVLVFWYAETRDAADYAYEVRPLREECLENGKYVVEASPESDGWFILSNGDLRAYAFDGFTDGDRKKLLFRMRLSLRRVARTPELDRRLHIER